ncbi:NTAN1 amidohydrolase, partial [Atractosteus spatula]|nr:NTAN1 amidohydrolase [Atractosteus spatula]
MPLFANNQRIERPYTTTEFFGKCPHFKKSARSFRERAARTVGPQGLLYVQQRELAATTPADDAVTVMGSDDATTCHLVALRHTGSGAACLAHCDGSGTAREVPLIVRAVTSLSSHAHGGRLELHLVGGFDDDMRTSHNLSFQLLAAFDRQTEDIHLVTCCISELNDVVSGGTHRPVVYGIGVDVRSGDVFPASFPSRGPAEDLRSARTFAGGQMANIYDAGRGLVRIGPCKWSPNPDIAFWLTQDDDTILKHLSTSPLVEPPHFVQHIKSTIRFLLEHPNPDSLFPGGEPQLYCRSAEGGWERAPEGMQQ